MSQPAAAGPLTGCCIVTTRPAGQAAGLMARLEAQGAEVINFPVIAIDAADPAPLVAADLAAFDMAFFVSANAVEQAFRIRPRADWPDQLRVAAVGPASARALTAQGWPRIIVPQSGFDSEAVLALPEFSAEQLAGRRVLILKGEGGRDLLARTIGERGAALEQICVYQRSKAALDPAGLLARAARGELDALVFSASEGLRFFLEITGEAGRALLAARPCFAPHPRIVSALVEAGAGQAVQSEPGDEGIVAALLGHFAPGQPAPGGAPRTRD
ncbi:uroporphyrinogen-III synthase [Uliginosibacterium paludis]|uniref:Uroporphyrinogen-III synthase n=1 Tax=Uliginosibacterium paludis TaxID=1615952 RepID=A0ABV2CMU9_9RHOO